MWRSNLLVFFEFCISHWMKKTLIIGASCHKRAWKFIESWAIPMYIHMYLIVYLIQFFFVESTRQKINLYLHFRSEWLAFCISLRIRSQVGGHEGKSSTIVLGLLCRTSPSYCRAWKRFTKPSFIESVSQLWLLVDIQVVQT